MLGIGILLCGGWAVAVRAEGSGSGASAAVAAPAKGGKAAATNGARSATSKRAKNATPNAPAATATVSGPEVRNFQTFCDEWMQKLHDRETYNTAHIAWENDGGHVDGEYVGYGTTCTCIAREEPGKDPIGKISYRETRYRREGTTETEALAVPGTVLEQSDVTEIFRYGKGRWQY